MANRMLTKKPATKPSGTSTPAGAIGGRQIRVFMNPVLPKTNVNLKLGTATMSFSESENFSGGFLMLLLSFQYLNLKLEYVEVMRQVLRVWNGTWNDDCSESLKRYVLSMHDAWIQC
jgi:hypothetical protein